MEQIYFNNINELGNRMYELANEENITNSAILLYEDAIKLIKWLMVYDDINIDIVNIESGDFREYKDEFVITLFHNLNQEYVSLEVAPAYRIGMGDIDGEEQILKSSIIFCGGDTSTKLCFENKYANKYEVVINGSGLNDVCSNCCGDCSNCHHKGLGDSISEMLDFFDYICNNS